MQNRPVSFDASAGSYFIVFLVTIFMQYIPILGWAFAFNFMGNWVAENAEVNGKKVVYRATYAETLKFVFINTLLILVTIGIYLFWFIPKSYKYFVDHIQYDDAPPAPAPLSPPTPPMPPEAPTPPISTPTPPVPPAPTPPTLVQ